MATCEGPQQSALPLAEFVTVCNQKQKKERRLARAARCSAPQPTALPAAVPAANNPAFRQPMRPTRQKQSPPPSTSRPIPQQSPAGHSHFQNNQNSHQQPRNSVQFSPKYIPNSSRSAGCSPTCDSAVYQRVSTPAVIRPAAWSKVLNTSASVVAAKNAARAAPCRSSATPSATASVATVSIKSPDASSWRNGPKVTSVEPTAVPCLPAADCEAMPQSARPPSPRSQTLTISGIQQESSEIKQEPAHLPSPVGSGEILGDKNDAGSQSPKSSPTPSTESSSVARSGDSKFTSPITQKPQMRPIPVAPRTPENTVSNLLVTMGAPAKAQRITGSPASSRRVKRTWAPLALPLPSTEQSAHEKHQRGNNNTLNRNGHRGLNSARQGAHLEPQAKDSASSIDSAGFSEKSSGLGSNSTVYEAKDSAKSSQTLTNSSGAINPEVFGANGCEKAKRNQNGGEIRTRNSDNALPVGQDINSPSQSNSTVPSTSGDQRGPQDHVRNSNYSQRRTTKNQSYNQNTTNGRRPSANYQTQEGTQQPGNFYPNACYFFPAQALYMPSIQPNGVATDAIPPKCPVVYTPAVGLYALQPNQPENQQHMQQLQQQIHLQQQNLAHLHPSQVQYFPAQGYYHPSQWPSFVQDLYSAIRYQVEFYFSFENLIHDLYLRSCMDSNGWVSLRIVLDFPRMRYLAQNNIGLVFEALKVSSQLEMDSENQSVRSRNDWEILVKLPLLPAQSKSASEEQESSVSAAISVPASSTTV